MLQIQNLKIKKKLKNAFKIQKLFFLVLLICILNLSQCAIPLNQTQLQQLSNFITAKYLTLQQEKQLYKKYLSLPNPLGNYRIQIQDKYQFSVNNIQSCQFIPSYVTFDGFDDIWILLKCNKEWELKIKCGTFYQVHKPFDTDVIYSRALNLDQDFSKPINLPVINVCAGTFHIWFIYSTRIGKVIKHIKPVFISNPSC